MRIRLGHNVEQIARQRGFTIGTIHTHLATAMEAGERIELNRFFTASEQQQIAAAFARTGFGNLSGAFEALGGNFDYGRLRLYRAARNQAAREKTPPQS